MGTYVPIITNLKVACPATEITPSLKLKVITTRSVARNRIGKRLSQNIIISEKSDETVPYESGISASRVEKNCKSAHAFWFYNFLFINKDNKLIRTVKKHVISICV